MTVGEQSHLSLVNKATDEYYFALRVGRVLKKRTVYMSKCMYVCVFMEEGEREREREREREVFSLLPYVFHFKPHPSRFFFLLPSPPSLQYFFKYINKNL